MITKYIKFINHRATCTWVTEPNSVAKKDLLYLHNKSQLVPVMEEAYVEWQITV